MNDSENAKSLFMSAIEKYAPDQWPAFLDGACGDNLALRRRVEELLQAHLDLGSIRTSEQARTLDQPLAEKPGSQIGPYKLLQEIGQGGMGVVYMAEQQEPVKRRVALKIIKPGMDTRQVIARFEAERQALSLMDHPNIAKVLDAGATDSGRPYFVMELVKGQPITQYCDEHQLTPRQRLMLLLPVCQAIQHAHQKGIIHRDIKPTNILVTEYDQQPVPKVIDFGVAKATSQTLTEKTMFTGYGQIIGTLEYMSPEQAKVNQLDIDTRSDIYSLGVLLYELLTGSTPFDRKRLRSAAFDEVLRIIREEEPPKPSTRLSESKEMLPAISAQRQIEPGKLTELVRGELDWIVMKALEKDRNRRYETASGLALDIQRYLSDEPISACPPSAGYRLRKFARRNKALLATATTIAAALVLGLAGTSWQAIRATRAESRALANAQRAIEERDAKESALREVAAGAEREAIQRRAAEEAAKAERNAKEAETRQRELAEKAERKATEEAAVAKAVNEFLRKDLLGLAGAEAQLNAGVARQPELKLATLLDRALVAVERRFADQPRIRAEIQETLAESFQAIGRFQEAEALWIKIRQYRQSALGPNHHDTLASTSNLANACLASGQNERALRLFEETHQLTTATLGPEHPDSLISMTNLASAYQSVGRYDKAVPLFEAAFELQTSRRVPPDRLTLAIMANLANAYRVAGLNDKALPLAEKTLKLRTELLGPEHPDTLDSMNTLAVIYLVVGQREKALAMNQQAVQLLRAQLGPDHPLTLNSTNNLALAYRVNGQNDQALKLIEDSVRRLKAKVGAEHPLTLNAMDNLANAYRAAGHHDKALPLAEESLRLVTAALGPEHPDTLNSMNTLASAYQAVGQLDQALPLAKKACEILSAKLGPEHPDTLNALNNLAVAYQQVKRFDDAIALLEQVLEIHLRVSGANHSESLLAKTNLAVTCLSAGQVSRAEAALSEALATERSLEGDAHPLLPETLLYLALTYREQLRLPEAQSLAQQACVHSRRLWGDDHHLTIRANAALSTIFWEMDRRVEAIELAKAVLERNLLALGPNHPTVVDWRERLLVFQAESLVGQGSYADAEAKLRECIASRLRREPRDWDTLAAQSLLGETITKQGRHAEAEPLLLESYRGMRTPREQLTPKKSRQLARAVERLVTLYSDWSKLDEAARWQRESETLKK